VPGLDRLNPRPSFASVALITVAVALCSCPATWPLPAPDLRFESVGCEEVRVSWDTDREWIADPDFECHEVPEGLAGADIVLVEEGEVRYRRGARRRVLCPGTILEGSWSPGPTLTVSWDALSLGPGEAVSLAARFEEGNRIGPESSPVGLACFGPPTLTPVGGDWFLSAGEEPLEVLGEHPSSLVERLALDARVVVRWSGGGSYDEWDGAPESAERVWYVAQIQGESGSVLEVPYARLEQAWFEARAIAEEPSARYRQARVSISVEGRVFEAADDLIYGADAEVRELCADFDPDLHSDPCRAFFLYDEEEEDR